MNMKECPGWKDEWCAEPISDDKDLCDACQARMESQLYNDDEYDRWKEEQWEKQNDKIKP